MNGFNGMIRCGQRTVLIENGTVRCGQRTVLIENGTIRCGQRTDLKFFMGFMTIVLRDEKEKYFKSISGKFDIQTQEDIFHNCSSVFANKFKVLT